MSVVISTVKNESKIKADKWNEMNVNDLIDQKNHLFDFLTFLQSQDGSTGLQQQIYDGINKIDGLIDQKSQR